MINITPSLPPAMEAYLTALIYRNTRTDCLSFAALCSWVSYDALNRLLQQPLAGAEVAAAVWASDQASQTSGPHRLHHQKWKVILCAP